LIEALASPLLNPDLESRLEGAAMTALALTLKPIDHGWAVALSDGRELVRFIGLGAKRRALRYLARFDSGKELGNAR
jgi:hypothetical protein